MDLLECPICLENFEEPLLLPGCGHTFCRKCVDQIVASPAPAGIPSLLGGLGHAAQHRCPTCRAPFRQGEPRPNYALRQLLGDASRQPAGTVVATSRPSAPPFSLLPNQQQQQQQQQQQALGGPSGCAAQCDGTTAPLGGGGGTFRRGLTRDFGSSERNYGDSDLAKIRRLQSLGVPFALARLLEEEDRQIGLRIFLLDNSGSTAAYDGHYFEAAADGRLISRPCTRWEEIKRMAMEHAQWNATIGTPCEFMLLNPGPGPIQEGRDFVRISPGPTGIQGQEALESIALGPLRRMLDRTGPQGCTPVADRLEEIYQRVRNEHASLVTQGQRVVLVFATDGLPTSAFSGQSTASDKQRMVAGLKRLMMELNVFVVIRLATDDDDVASYYNAVDEELELPLEVLDDIEGEAKGIREIGNGWLAYSPLLHRIREGGTFMKLFDLLDERRLSPVEVSLVAQLLLRGEHDPPMPFHSAEEFLSSLENQLAGSASPMVYDPYWKRMGPPVHLNAVRFAVLPGKAYVAAALRSFATVVATPLTMLLGGATRCGSSDPRVLGRTPSTDVVA